MSWMEAVVWSGAYGGWQQPCYCFEQGRSWPLLHSKGNPYQAAFWWSLHNWFLFHFILITLQKYIFHQIESLSSLKPWKGLDSITSEFQTVNSELGRSTSKQGYVKPHVPRQNSKGETIIISTVESSDWVGVSHGSHYFNLRYVLSCGLKSMFDMLC